MGKDFWLDIWEKNNIPFHREEPHPKLLKYFSNLAPTKVFVPLCGKSVDMVWLLKQGHEVVGVELSSIACKDFFDGIPYQTQTVQSFERYQADKISIYCGDIFEFKSEEKFGAVYDRAALIALPTDIRKAYAKLIVQLDVKKMLLLSFEYPEGEVDGPPYSVGEREIQGLFGSRFELESLFKEAAGASKNEKLKDAKGLLSTGYLLRPKN